MPMRCVNQLRASAGIATGLSRQGLTLNQPTGCHERTHAT